MRSFRGILGNQNMTLSKKPYKGTRDFFPQQKRIQDYIFDKMASSALSYGYEHYDGPLLEEVELYKAKSGEELINDQIYSFHDRGERFVAIRPEMTPTLARMIAQIQKEEIKPIRWFSIPNLYRYEKPQRGRLREHWQFNCDIFGAPGRMGEVEIVQVIVNLLTSFGADQTQFAILINDREIVDCLFNDILKVDTELSYKLYKIIDKSKKVDEQALTKMLGETNLNEEQAKILLSYLSLKDFEQVSQFLKTHNLESVNENFMAFVSDIQKLELDKYLKYDPAIVRGLDYYTGIVFEVFDLNPQNPRAISGGGAYRDLLKIFGDKPLPGVGFGMGDVTLTDFLTTHNLLPDFSRAQNDLFLSYQSEACKDSALKLANELRTKGLKVICGLEPVKIKKVFPTAEKRGASFAALFGEDELQNNTVQIKNLESKEQSNIDLTDIDKIVKTIIG